MQETRGEEQREPGVSTPLPPSLQLMGWVWLFFYQRPLLLRCDLLLQLRPQHNFSNSSLSMPDISLVCPFCLRDGSRLYTALILWYYPISCWFPLTLHTGLATELVRPSAKWKRRTLCSKITKNCKMVTTRHYTQGRTLLGAGACVIAQAAHPWSLPCVHTITESPYRKQSSVACPVGYLLPARILPNARSHGSSFHLEKWWFH